MRKRREEEEEERRKNKYNRGANESCTQRWVDSLALSRDET